MKRHEFWRIKYRSRRYLEHVAAKDLAQRVRDCMNNLMGLTAEGKVGPLEIEEGGGYWLETFTHCLEEYKLRGLVPPNGMMKGAALPKPSYPDAPRALRVFNQLRA